MADVIFFHDNDGWRAWPTSATAREWLQKRSTGYWNRTELELTEAELEPLVDALEAAGFRTEV